MTKADTIARHVTQAATHIKTALELSHEPGGDVGGCVDAAARCINAAFLEALGGAAVAGEAVPEPPKPAGWVLPVDAAGNVIEAEDIGATLRREECERKAARQSGVAWEAARAGEEAERLRTDLAAVKAERDEVRAERDKWAANAGTLNASLRQVHTECDQLRAELDATLAERDALAAEVQRAREQKPVRWAVVLTTGHVASVWHEPDIAAEVAATVAGRRVAPLYLAPVVRDVSGVIAQCEEALRESSGLVIATDVMRPALRAALSALRGAS